MKPIKLTIDQILSRVKEIRRHRPRIYDAVSYLVKNAGESRVNDAAAGLTFFTLFSLFPVLAIVIAGTGLFLSDTSAQKEVLDAFFSFFPDISHQIILENIRQVLEYRKTSGILGAVGLIWASTSYFAGLVDNINRAWPQNNGGNLFKNRLFGILIVFFLVVMLHLFFVAKTVFHVALSIKYRFLSYLYFYSLLRLISKLIIPVFIFLIFTLIYRWIPHTKVRWREASAGGLFSTFAFSAVTSAFTWYLKSGLSKYNLIYGSLGSLVALMTWIFIINFVVLFGAHISSATAYFTRPKTLEE